MVLPVINIGSKLDGKGFKQADTATEKLTKSVKKAGLALAAAFSVQKIVAFGKASVKAFAEDEAAAAKLTRTVNNLGLGFDNVRITKFISDLEKTAAVSDDILRPAFNSLLTTTGSVEKSQKMLSLALDVAAGSGESVATVTNDLAAAYVGNTKGLTKYRLGLTKAELAGKSFNEIQDLLNTQFSGQNATRLDTYAGKMAILGVAAGNAQEIIGKGLVDAISKLGDDDSVKNLADDMETAAERTADVIRGIGVLIEKIKSIPGFNSDFGVLYDISYLALLEKLGKNDKLMPKPFTTPMTISGSTDKQTKENKARAKAEADAAKRAKELLALQKKSALAEKNKLSLSQAAAFFDSQRISIAAALKATYDAETKLRLEALMAIEDENGKLAIEKIEELARLQNSKDMDRLKGITIIKDAVLGALNDQLLAELSNINASEEAEAEKNRLRDIAFGKYNAAITAAGEVAEKSYYSERVQIQLTEIARLASLYNSTNAAITLEKLRMEVSLNVIASIREAQAEADAERYRALEEYIRLLQTLGPDAVGLRGASADSINALIEGSQAELDALAMEAAAIAAMNRASDLVNNLYNNFGGVRSSASLGRNTNTTDYFNSLSNFAQSSFGGYSPTMNSGAAGTGAGGNYNYVINVNAGVIGSEQLINQSVQEALLAINRAGDSTTVAGNL
jgi:hypothetical protein